MTSLPILYSFRRCPYAMRARMALWISGARVQLREVELKAKPSALIAASPKGTVPVLQLPSGEVIGESREVMEWALTQNDPEHWLGSAQQRAAATTLIDTNDGTFKGHLDRYKYPGRYAGQTTESARAEGEVFLQTLERSLDRQAFLVGGQRSLADIAIFPFIRQFSLVDPGWFATSPYPHLRSWLSVLIDSELFAAVMGKYPPWSEGQTPIVLGYLP